MNSEVAIEEIQSLVREFLQPHFPDYDLNDNDDIFTLGFINSLFALQLVLFVENKFSLQLEDDDYALINFRTIRSISALVLKKLNL